MANRKGVFIGAYVDPVLKRDLKLAATAGFRTMSQDVERRLAISLYGTGEVPGSKAKGRLQAALLNGAEAHKAAAANLKTVQLAERLRRLVEGNPDLFGYRAGDDALGSVVMLVERLAASPELSKAAAPRRRRAVARPCGNGYQRHLFSRKRGGRPSHKCVRCKAPRRGVTAGARGQSAVG